MSRTSSSSFAEGAYSSSSKPQTQFSFFPLSSLVDSPVDPEPPEASFSCAGWFVRVCHMDLRKPSSLCVLGSLGSELHVENKKARG